MMNGTRNQGAYHIRRVTFEDAPVVAKLVGALYTELHEGSDVPDYRLESVDTVLRDTERCFGFLAFNAEQPVGVILLAEAVAIFAGGAFGQISELYVEPEYRSRGIASLLVAHATAFSRERGWKRIDVGTPHQPRWSRSLGFYYSEGFVEVGPRLRLDL